MNLFHAEFLNARHHQMVRERAAADPLPVLPSQPARLWTWLEQRSQFFSQLRGSRVQITFEAAEGSSEVVTGSQ